MGLNKAQDRCDGVGILVFGYEGGDVDWKKGGTCGAQAYVRVLSAEGLDLLFCGHHYNKAADALMLQGFTVDVDDRASLTAHNKLVGSEN